MEHHCDAALVTCEDFRLHQRHGGSNCVAEFVRGLTTDCDLITRAGGIQDLVRPRPGYDEALLRDLEVSVNLHKVRRIILVQHEDCGAYRPFGFRSREEEVRQHREDLEAARGILETRFPGVEIVGAIARLRPGSSDQYTVEITG